MAPPIHTLHKGCVWVYLWVSMNFKISVSPQTLTNVAKLDQFRGRWSNGVGISGTRLERLAEVATIQSAGASCRLSGIRVSDIEVAEILRDESVLLGDARAVRGYVAGARHSLLAPDRLLTSQDLRELHAILSGSAEQEQSPWRAQPLQREGFDAQGRAIGRVYSTLPPRLISGTMENLLTWLEYELRANEQHPILVIAVFTLGMIASCPFEQGNGRLARSLIGHLMSRAGYAYIPYASIETQIEELRDQYHEAFDLSQTSFRNGGEDFEPWIEFFMEVLNRHRERVEVKTDLERESLDFPPLQKAILETVREHGTVDAGLLIKATGANRNTLKDNLRKLVDRGLLTRTGERRGTRYHLSSGHRPAPSP